MDGTDEAGKFWQDVGGVASAAGQHKGKHGEERARTSGAPYGTKTGGGRSRGALARAINNERITGGTAERSCTGEQLGGGRRRRAMQHAA